jgi:hypothetical protein
MNILISLVVSSLSIYNRDRIQNEGEKDALMSEWSRNKELVVELKQRT